MDKEEYDCISEKLAYRFKDKRIIEEALSHSSYVNELSENDLRDNERLEFLGDAVLNLAVGHLLMERFPDLKEGELSRMRANLVNETQLASLARAIDLGEHLRLGRGEVQTRGQEKNSILADATEAVLAAIYLDGGFAPAFHFVETHIGPHLHCVFSKESDQDFKSRLQELVQAKLKVVPTYEVISESGPDHDKTFEVQIKVGDLMAVGVGKNKKSAEQSAAGKALEILEQIKL